MTPTGDPTGYEVQRFSEDGSQVAELTRTGNGDGYSQPEMDADTKYFYRARAINSHGQGPWSTVVIGVKEEIQEALGVPGGLIVSAASDTQIDLLWTTPSGSPTGYDVWWSANGETEWKEVDPPSRGTGTHYGHTGLTPNTTYYYSVRAERDNGGGEWTLEEGDWSAVVSATTQSTLQAVATPGAPGDMDAAAMSDTRIDLLWSATDPASTGYEVEWSADGETGWQAVEPPGGGADTIYSHTGLTPETTYHYRVRGVNDEGAGAWSEAVSATTQESPELHGHQTAHHQRHGPSGRNPHGGYLRHFRRGRPGQRDLQLPMDGRQRD